MADLPARARHPRRRPSLRAGLVGSAAGLRPFAAGFVLARPEHAMTEPAEIGPRLVIVRHGETEWSRTGRHTGRTDLPLTDKGRAAALALGPVLEGERFAIVLTSPLQRARETAALAGFPDAVVCDDLREWDYGDDEGRTTAEINEDRPGW